MLEQLSTIAPMLYAEQGHDYRPIHDYDILEFIGKDDFSVIVQYNYPEKILFLCWWPSFQSLQPEAVARWVVKPKTIAQS